MRRFLRILSLVVVLAVAAGSAWAQTVDNMPVATVNGEALLYTEYAAVERTYILNYLNAGIDPSDPSTAAYIQDMALSTAIENLLIEQDMRAQGCYEFDAETEAWFVQQGTEAYEKALLDVGEMLRDTLDLGADEDMSAAALQYAQELGVTAESYIEVYRNQYATVKYYEWLTGGQSVTEEELMAAYEERVASSRALYEGDAAAFERAVNAGSEVWYKPEGYRTVLQILLPAEGESDQEKLASAAKTLDEIRARIDNGEDYKVLIAEYTTDPAFEDEAFYQVGYQVHRESVIWEDAFIAAAFSETMQQPGCWSEAFASDLGVHILYYLEDAPSGPIKLTEEIHDALSYVLYSERCQSLLAARLDELADAAQIVFH